MKKLLQLAIINTRHGWDLIRPYDVTFGGIPEGTPRGLYCITRAKWDNKNSRWIKKFVKHVTREEYDRIFSNTTPVRVKVESM